MHTTPRPRRTFAPVLIALAALLAVTACAAGGATPPAAATPPAGSTPPAALAVTSPEDAAALVVASDPRFEGVMPLDPQVIGASRWWEATENADGSFTVKVTIGWGDCQAGCINRHTWTYEVARDGALQLLEESGDEVPAGLTP